MNSRNSIYDVKSFYRKDAVHKASFQGMRYQIWHEDEGLSAVVWPEPFCFEKTPEEQKNKQAFSFDEEGLDQAYDWICKQYEDRKDQWQQYHKHPFEGMF